MKTCKTCKFWEDPYHESYHMPDKKECTCIEDVREGTITEELVCISTQDMHGRNVLMTSPNFGCTLHEEK